MTETLARRAIFAAALPGPASSEPVDVRTIGGDLELWLAERARASPDESVFWAPHGWNQQTDWIKVRSFEQLAVLISTAIRDHNNVCFVSGTRDLAGRSANVIALITRRPPGWAVVVKDHNRGQWAGDVQRIDFRSDNYDSFGALSAAEICWAWVTSGRLPEGLTRRLRHEAGRI